MNGQHEGHSKRSNRLSWKIFNAIMVIGGAYVVLSWIKDWIATGSPLNYWLS